MIAIGLMLVAGILNGVSVQDPEPTIQVNEVELHKDDTQILVLSNFSPKAEQFTVEDIKHAGFGRESGEKME